MSILVLLFGALLLLFLTLSGLLLIVAPVQGRRMFQKTTAFVGLTVMLLVAVNALRQMVDAFNPLLLILGVAALSSFAYFIRERRLSNSKRPDGARHSERSPVMPQVISRDDE